MKRFMSNYQDISLNCGVVTVSDTRTLDNDTSGGLIKELLTKTNHQVKKYIIIKDEPSQIQQILESLAQDNSIQVIIFNGGTGVSRRDVTYDVLERLLEKTLPGFGELFRWLSYQEIGTRTISSRTVAGIYHDKLIFSLPGSTNAVRLAMEKLILPEIVHLTRVLNSQ